MMMMMMMRIHDETFFTMRRKKCLLCFEADISVYIFCNRILY
jgi:hypothetical protein